jgi:U3 small nucleolar RNA-associated protein 21
VIKSIAFSTARSKDWDDVVTYHEGESMGRSWSVDGKRMGKWTLKTDGVVTVSVSFSHDEIGTDGMRIQTTAVTACGNFGLVGSDAGVVVSYNLQSGLKRKVFNVPSGGANDTKGRHITGVATDALNRVLIVSTLKGGIYVRFLSSLALRMVLTIRMQLFDFQTMTLRESIVLPANITSIVLHRENGLLAVTCDDLTVRIIDIETRRIVRELSGFRGAILDLVRPFTPSCYSILMVFGRPSHRTLDGSSRRPKIALSAHSTSQQANSSTPSAQRASLPLSRTHRRPISSLRVTLIL